MRAKLVPIVLLVAVAVAASFLAWTSRPADATGENESNVPAWFTEGTFGGVDFALDSADNPVIVYSHDFSLDILQCTNPTCSGDSPLSLDGFEDFFPALALDEDEPVFAFVRYNVSSDPFTVSLEVRRPPYVPPFPRLEEVVFGSGSTLGPPAIALDSAGRPVVAYSGPPDAQLRVVRCGDGSCTSGNNIQLLEPGIEVGAVSLRLDSADRPVVAFHDVTNGDLKLLRCGDATCSSGNTTATVDAAGDVGHEPSMVLDASERPVISYYDASNEDLKLARCLSPMCGSSTVRTVASTGNVGLGSSVGVAQKDKPVISYTDRTAGTVNVVACGDATCTSGNTVTQQAPLPSSVFNETSLLLDANGLPAIVYGTDGPFDPTMYDGIGILRCGNPACADPKPAPTPTPTPKDPNADLDGDTVSNSSDLDDDGDGCDDTRELQKTAGSETSGGLRNPHHYWDFFDVPAGDELVRDKVVGFGDVAAVLSRTPSSGDPGIDPLTTPPPAPAYHTAYDRGGSSGPYTWSLLAADGSLGFGDVTALLNQVPHSCA